MALPPNCVRGWNVVKQYESWNRCARAQCLESATMKSFADMLVLAFVMSSVLSVGMFLSWQQILVPLRQFRLLALALLANFVVVPVVAVALARGMSLNEPQSVGLILLGAAAGAPFVPKLIETARGDVALSVATMVLLMVGSLICLPLLLPIMLPGVTVNSGKIAQSLLITMIFPLVLGLVLKAFLPAWADGLRPFLNLISQITLLLSLTLICVHQFHGLQQLIVTWAIPACVTLVVVSFVIGFAVGGPARSSRETMGFGTAGRNIPAALLVGGQNFENPEVMLMIILSALVSVVIFVPIALLAGRRGTSQSA